MLMLIDHAFGGLLIVDYDYNYAGAIHCVGTYDECMATWDDLQACGLA